MSLRYFVGMHKARIFLISLVWSLSLETAANAMNCNDVRHLVNHYLRLHFSANKFTNDLGKATLKNFLKAWDPGKVYFLQEDIDRFNEKFSDKIPEMISNNNCSAIEVIFSQYSKRYSERQAAIPALINMKHDFKVDEYMNIDRKNMKYAGSIKEIDERWRKRIKFQHLQLLQTMNDHEKIRGKLKKRYALLDKRHKGLDTDDVLESFLDAFSTALDPHSDYFSKTQLEEFRISTRLSLEGIGALLRSEDGVTSIQSLVPGGAAQKSNLIKIDDKIVAVAQGEAAPVDVIDMDLREVVKLIRGPGGTEVRLTLRRDSKELVVPIIREKIQLKDRAAKSKIYNVRSELPKVKESYKIGVVDLPSFYMDFEGRQANKENFRSSSRDMQKEIEGLIKKKVSAIIVDLRSNGGGSLDEAINVAGLFSGKGPVVQIKGASATPFVSRFEGKPIFDGPLVLLIDRQSASASEILAGAIQDYGRGVIVGDSHTFGKGTVQNLSDLSSRLGAIKVTISKFYRPSGGSTQLKGVASDIVLPSISDHYEIGEKHYDSALPWEKLAEVKHKQFNLVDDYKSKLRLASAARVKNSKDFKEIMEAIEKYEKGKKERMRVSLKEKSKEEKAKDAKERKELEEKEKQLAKDKYGNLIPQLKDDPTLQESIYIATDYVRLLEKKNLARLKILELKNNPKAKKANKK